MRKRRLREQEEFWGN
nr:prostaglandin E2 receptor [Homo sapiens]